jgi:hypothetical protein
VHNTRMSFTKYDEVADGETFDPVANLLPQRSDVVREVLDEISRREEGRSRALEVNNIGVGEKKTEAISFTLRLVPCGGGSSRGSEGRGSRNSDGWSSRSSGGRHGDSRSQSPRRQLPQGAEVPKEERTSSSLQPNFADSTDFHH